MKAVLQALNKTPGVLGSAFVCDGAEAVDCGESIGGPAALDLARRAVEAVQGWSDAGGAPLDAAVFVGSDGRIVVQKAGSGTLVAFAENVSAAGLLKMRIRAAAKQMNSAL